MIHEQRQLGLVREATRQIAGLVSSCVEHYLECADLLVQIIAIEHSYREQATQLLEMMQQSIEGYRAMLEAVTLVAEIDGAQTLGLPPFVAKLTRALSSSFGHIERCRRPSDLLELPLTDPELLRAACTQDETQAWLAQQ